MNTPTQSNINGLETLRSFAPTRDPTTLGIRFNHALTSINPELEKAIANAANAFSVNDLGKLRGALIQTRYLYADLARQQAEAGKSKISDREVDLERKYLAEKQKLQEKLDTFEHKLNELETSQESLVKDEIREVREELIQDRTQRFQLNSIYQKAFDALFLNSSDTPSESTGLTHSDGLEKLLKDDQQMRVETQTKLEEAQAEHAKTRGAAGLSASQSANELPNGLQVGLGVPYAALSDQKTNTWFVFLVKLGAAAFTATNLLLLIAEGKIAEVVNLHPIFWVSSIGFAIALVAGSNSITEAAQISASQIQQAEFMKRFSKEEVFLNKWNWSPNMLTAIVFGALIVLLEASLGYLGFGAALQKVNIACGIAPELCSKPPQLLVIATSSLVGVVLVITSYSYGKVLGINHANKNARDFLVLQHHLMLQSDPKRQAVLAADIALQDAQKNFQSRRSDFEANKTARKQLLADLRSQILNLGTELEREQTTLNKLEAPIRQHIEQNKEHLRRQIATARGDLDVLRQNHAASVATLESHVEALMQMAEGYTFRLEQLLQGEATIPTPTAPTASNEIRARPNKPRNFFQRIWDFLTGKGRKPTSNQGFPT